MYKNNLPNVNTYYHHIKITYSKKIIKGMHNCLEPQLMNFLVDYFVNPKYLDL